MMCLLALFSLSNANAGDGLNQEEDLVQSNCPATSMVDIADESAAEAACQSHCDSCGFAVMSKDEPVDGKVPCECTPHPTLKQTAMQSGTGVNSTFSALALIAIVAALSTQRNSE